MAAMSRITMCTFNLSRAFPRAPSLSIRSSRRVTRVFCTSTSKNSGVNTQGSNIGGGDVRDFRPNMRYDDSMNEAKGQASEMADRTKETVKEGTQDTKEKAKEYGNTAKEYADSAKERAKEGTERASDTAKEYAKAAKDRAKEGTERVSDTAHDVKERAKQQAYDKSDKATEATKSMGEKAKETVQEAWDTAKGTARKITETVVGPPPVDEVGGEKKMDEDVIDLRRRQGGDVTDRNKI